MRIKPIAKAGCGVICAFFGFVCCFREQMFPHYRTVEVSPGIFQEQWMSGRELWLFIGSGIALFALSGYLFWSAYRTFRHAHNADGSRLLARRG
jgi:hypothetical protein